MPTTKISKRRSSAKPRAKKKSLDRAYSSHITESVERAPSRAMLHAVGFNDADFRKRIKDDPEGTVKSFPLDGAEIEALILGDVGTLFQMGVHTFFLNHLARYEMFGVTRDNYLERIRSHMEYDPRFELGAMPLQYVPKEP